MLFWRIAYRIVWVCILRAWCCSRGAILISPWSLNLSKWQASSFTTNRFTAKISLWNWSNFWNPLNAADQSCPLPTFYSLIHPIVCWKTNGSSFTSFFSTLLSKFVLNQASWLDSLPNSFKDWLPFFRAPIFKWIYVGKWLLLPVNFYLRNHISAVYST